MKRHQCGVCCAVLAAEADPRCWLLVLPPLVGHLPATDETIMRPPNGSHAAAVWHLLAAVWQLWNLLPDGSQRHQCGVCWAVLAAEGHPRSWLLPATHDLGTKMQDNHQ